MLGNLMYIPKKNFTVQWSNTDGISYFSLFPLVDALPYILIKIHELWVATWNCVGHPKEISFSPAYKFPVRLFCIFLVCVLCLVRHLIWTLLYIDKSIQSFKF